MEKYTPKRDLPDDIKSMDKSETACRYCGVSYLIHHEFKKMETQLAVLQAELTAMKGCAQREAQLREQVKEKEARLSLAEVQLTTREERSA